MNKILLKFKNMRMINFILCLMLVTNLCISDFSTQLVSAAIVDENTTYVDSYMPDSILLNILKGVADANKDEKLTIAELRAYKGDENGKLDLKDKRITNVKGLGYASGVKSIDLSKNNSINTIPDETFMDCKNLRSIILPDGITSIGISAFEGCTYLTSINLPVGVATLGEKSFYQCTSLKSIELPVNIATIGNSAFSGSGLTSIEIPNAKVSLGVSVFNSCKELISVKLPEGMTIIPMEFFKASGFNGINLPSTIKTIEEGAFSECNLISIDLSKCTNLTAIKKSAFAASYLISIKLPESLTELGERAFENCSNLPEITLPSKITVINELTFSKCTSLKNITFMPSIESGSSTYKLEEIKTKAFYGCFNLGDEKNNVNFFANLDKLTTIGEQAFAYSYKQESTKDEYNQQVYTGIKSVILPKNLTELGKGVFKNCYSLSAVNIPNKITVLPDETFLNCYNLKNVTLSNILTTIGLNSFNNCYELNNITFPNSLVTIGNNAFLNCAKEKVKTEDSKKQYIYTGITTLNLPNSITDIGTGAFKGCFNLNAVKLPLNLITISDSLFDGCAKQLKGIDGKVIEGSYNGIREVTFPSAVTSIGNYAFKNCGNLLFKNGQIVNTLKTIGSGTFDGCKSITSFVIPSSLQSIGSSAFANCTNLEDVNFRSAGSLTTIGSSAFKFTGIKGIIRLPEKLQKIESSVFQGCTNITSVEFPDGLTSIGSLSFKDCTSLMGSTIPAAATIVYNGSSTSFYGCNDFTNAIIKAVPGTVSVSENSEITLPINCFSKINSADVSDVNIASAEISGDMKKVILSGVKEGQTKITVKGTMEYESGKDPKSGSPTINKFETKVEFNISVTAVKCTGVSFKDNIRGIKYDLKNSVQLNATITPLDTTDLKIWTSDNESVATVSEDGKVIPVGYGAATILLKVGEQPAVSCDVKVCAPASSISLDKTSQILVLGESTTLTPTVNYRSTYSEYKGDYPDVLLWNSSDTKIATVDSTGKVTTVGYGVTTITVKGDAGNVTKACTITVVPSSTTITFDKSSLNLIKGESTLITMTLNPANSPLSKVTVKTSSSGVAAISTNGNIITVTAKAGGTATITATPLSGTPAECNVVIKSPLTSITTKPMEVKKGASQNISIVKTPTDATDVIIYSSNNTNVATVDKAGRVTGISAGTAKIKIQSESSSVSTICDVTVNVGVTGVALNKTSDILNMESSLKLTSVVAPSDASNKNVSWTSSNPNIAIVSTNGVVTPVAAGTTSITVKTADGNHSARCSVTVTYAFAATITSDLPAKMLPGKKYSISFRVTNTGTETWSGSEFKLSPEQNDPLMSKLSGKVTLASGEKLRPGTTRNFTVSVAAPKKEGDYTTNWNITQKGISFGTIFTKRFIVKNPDTVKPTIKSVTPINNSKGVSLTENIIIQFSEPVKFRSSNIVLVDSSKDTISKDIRFEDPSNPVKLIIQPKNYLDPSTKYTFTIAASGIQDMEGNTLRSAFKTTFSTVLLPMVSSSVPFSGATKVNTNSVITVNFNESVLKGAGFENIELIDNNGNAVPYDADLKGKIVKIKPSIDLNQNAKYKLTIPTDAVKDSLGNILTREFILLFTTKMDTTAPTVISAVPKKSAKDVKLDSDILITFNKCIEVNTGKQRGFTLVSKAESIPVDMSTNGKILTITPSTQLSTNTNYTLTIPKEGVVDLVGNKLKSLYKLTFTTTDGKNVIVKSSRPSNGATRVSLSSTVTITFSKNIYKGDSFDDIIFKDSNGNVCKATMTIKNKVMTIKPKTKFLSKKSYALIIPIGSLKDIADNIQDTEYNITFSTI